MADKKEELKERKSRSSRNRQLLVLYALVLFITSVLMIVAAVIMYVIDKPYLVTLSVVYLDYTATAIVLFVCGIIGLFLGCFYCCLLQKDDGKITALWATLLILFIAEFIVACACWWYAETANYLEGYLAPHNGTMPAYMETIQAKEKCCGYNGKSDYQKVPDSCCPESFCGPTNGTTAAPFTDGCGDALGKRIYLFSLVIGVVAIFAGFVSACGFCGAFFMERRKKEESEPSQQANRRKINMDM